MPPTKVEIDGLLLTPSSNEAKWMWVTETKSGKFQAKPTLEKGGGQVDLGSFETALEAAKACARAFQDKEQGTLELKEKQQREDRGKKRERCACRSGGC